MALLTPPRRSPLRHHAWVVWVLVAVAVAVVLLLVVRPRDGLKEGMDPTIRISVGGRAGPRWQYGGIGDTFPYGIGQERFGLGYGMGLGWEGYREGYAHGRSPAPGASPYGAPAAPDLKQLEAAHVSPHYLATIDETRASDSPYPSQGDLLASLVYGYSQPFPYVSV